MERQLLSAYTHDVLDDLLVVAANGEKIPKFARHGVKRERESARLNHVNTDRIVTGGALQHAHIDAAVVFRDLIGLHVANGRV